MLDLEGVFCHETNGQLMSTIAPLGLRQEYYYYNLPTYSYVNRSEVHTLAVLDQDIS